MPSQSLFVRVLLWAFKNEIRTVLVIAILFAVGTGLGFLVPSESRNTQTTVLALFALLIFGVFLGIIVLTEDNKAYKGSGSRVRMLCGAVAFVAIAVLLSAPIETVALAALLGVILGYFGIYWAKYL